METIDFKLGNLFVKCTCVHNRIATSQYGFSFDCAPHNNLILIYDGKGVFERNGEKRNVKKGDLVFFAKGESQHMRTDPHDLLKLFTVNFQSILPIEKDGEWTLHNIEFPFPFVNHITDNMLFHDLQRLFNRLCRTFLSDSEFHEADERTIFVKILNMVEFSLRNKHLHCNYNVKSKIDEAIVYMSKYYYEKLTLDSIAAQFDLSPSHFSLMFKKITNYSVIDYLIKLRLSKAKLLLEDGKSISEVAEAVGFSDIYYFSKTFKKHVGLSPSSYRKDFFG